MFKLAHRYKRPISETIVRIYIIQLSTLKIFSQLSIVCLVLLFDANSALKTGLDSYSQIFGRYDVSQIAYGKKLDTLLQDRVTEKKNHADVITGLISQSREDVKGQIET